MSVVSLAMSRSVSSLVMSVLSYNHSPFDTFCSDS